jgi:outer membrane protein assembly factor BamB
MLVSTFAFLVLCSVSAFAQKTPIPSSARKVSVFTQRADNARSGTNFAEAALNTKSVDARAQLFGKLFSVAVDGNVYAQPLYAADVSFKKGSPRDVLYVATEKNNVYAIDANTGEQIWARNLGPSVPASDITAAGRGEMEMGSTWDYKDLYPDIGITSTPVIDLKSGTIFVVAKTKEGKPGAPQYHQRLHAIDLRTGAELQTPVEIQGSVSGSASDAKNHKIVFNPFLQLNRPGLLLVNGIVYVAFGSHGEVGPYHGWIFGYNSTAINQPPYIFCTTPDGEPLSAEHSQETFEWNRGGIWQSGTGLAADDQGAIYLATGDGAWDGKRNFSDSFLKLNNRLEILDWFTPSNHDTLDRHDIDLGSGGPVLLPGNLLIGGGKEGKLFVINRDHLGHTSPTKQAQDSEIVQQIQVTKLPPDPAHAADDHFHHLHGPPVFWTAPDGLHLYIWPEMESLKAFKLANGKLVPIGESQTPAPMPMPGMQTSMPGGILVLSSDGNQPGSAIVWSSIPIKDNANRRNVPGILRAFDASDVTRELWNSEMNPADQLGYFAKFCAPTVANGRVYMATFAPETGYPAAVQTGSAHIVVFGLFGRSGRRPPVEHHTSIGPAE